MATLVVIKEIKPKTSERKLFYMKISLSLVVWWWDKRQLLNVLDTAFSISRIALTKIKSLSDIFV